MRRSRELRKSILKERREVKLVRSVESRCGNQSINLNLKRKVKNVRENQFSDKAKCEKCFLLF